MHERGSQSYTAVRDTETREWLKDLVLNLSAARLGVTESPSPSEHEFDSMPVGSITYTGSAGRA